MASAVGAAGLFVMMSPTTSRSAVGPVGLAAAWFAGVTDSGAPARAGARCALPSSFGWQQEVLESMSFPSLADAKGYWRSGDLARRVRETHRLVRERPAARSHCGDDGSVTNRLGGATSPYLLQHADKECAWGEHR